MNISLEYFLAVAEEESISRAAERVMVSQQDMSNHIRRLEKQYGLLFERRPRFALTPAGEAVLATYRQVRLLEESLEDRLRDLREDTEGTIRLGMHIARARILVPPAAARFWTLKTSWSPTCCCPSGPSSTCCSASANGAGALTSTSPRPTPAGDSGCPGPSSPTSSSSCPSSSW